MSKNGVVHTIVQVVVCLSLCTTVLSSCESRVYAAQADPPPPWRPWNVNGTQRLVVICTEFSDVSCSTNVSTIRTRLNNMATYFHTISLGKMSIDFTLFGDEWLRLNNTMEYYGQGSWKNDLHGWDFVVDSVKAWERFVNFSDYEYLAVIHAGEDQAAHPDETQLLWSWDFGNFGHNSKFPVNVDGHTYSFWGLAYESEFDEFGVIAHEFGHGLGLPDLYVENKTLAFDPLSLMAGGSWNGSPQGTCPAPLDGFSMYMLGGLSPTTVELNSTEDFFELNPSGSDSPSVLVVPISDTEYYMVEVREKSGYDEYSVSSTSVIVYMIDEMKESANGIATVMNGGIVAQGSVYSDVARNIYVSFVSFNSSTHIARVGLSTQLLFARIDISNSIECFTAALGEVQIFDANNNPVPNAELNITIDEDVPILRITNEKGKADFQLAFGPCELGNHIVRITSPSMLAGQTERVTVVVFPWEPLIILLLAIAFVASLSYIVKNRRSRHARANGFSFPLRALMKQLLQVGFSLWKKMRLVYNFISCKI